MEVHKDNIVVFPTHVGMNREHDQTEFALACVPHARGDEPLEAVEAEIAILCSPRTWG